MKNSIKNSIKELSFFIKKLKVRRSYQRRHKSVFTNGEFVLTNLSSNELKSYRQYWKNPYCKVYIDSVVISKSLSKKFDVRIVPEEYFANVIEPKLNSRNEISFLETKSIYNKWFVQSVFPKDYFHKINGRYYDSDLKVISNIEEFIDNVAISFPIVCKPSVDSYGGANVSFLSTKAELKKMIRKFNDLVIQEKIIQHNSINEMYDGSINTIRVCLYKSVKTGELHVVNTSLRMGKDGSLDNETAGGIVCNIDVNGVFNDYAVDKYAKKYYYHPNSNFIFKNKVLSYYNELLKVSLSVGEQVVFANLLSLDMCLDSKGEWRCIEINLIGQTIRFAQYAGNSFFGDFTDEVKEFINLSKRI